MKTAYLAKNLTSTMSWDNKS